MLDLKKIRETPDAVKEGLVARGADPAAVDEILALDAVRREKTAAVQALQNERNATSKKIGAAKKAGEDTTAIQAEMRALGDRIAALDKEASEVDEKQRAILLALPNLPAPGVVPGGKEANEVVSVWGEKPVFDFEPKDHVELCTKLGLIDYDRGVRMGGNGFWLYRGMGARLEWALLNYFIQEHLKDGFEFILPVGISGSEDATMRMLCRHAAQTYSALVDNGTTPEIARAVLPNATATTIVVSGNLREWRHALRLRTDSHAHPQIRALMTPLLAELREKMPVVFEDIGGAE